jgi:hypothetical protein
MAKISLDSQPLGVIVDPNSADMSHPPANCAWPLVMSRKIIGDTTPKVVRLSHVYSLKRAGSGLFAEDINAAYGVKRSADVIKIGRMNGPV